MLKVLSNLYILMFNWFYTTKLGGIYFNLLLWIDRNTNKKAKYLTPKEIAQIVRESNQITDGILVMKTKINKLLISKSKEEYNKVLSEIEDMIPNAENEWDSDRAKLTRALRQVYIKKGSVDIVTDTDRAKMVDQRIKDMQELHGHIEKRELLRKIRSNRVQGNLEQSNKLEQEFLTKYGRHNTRHRQS